MVKVNLNRNVSISLKGKVYTVKSLETHCRIIYTIESYDWEDMTASSHRVHGIESIIKTLLKIKKDIDICWLAEDEYRKIELAVLTGEEIEMPCCESLQYG